MTAYEMRISDWSSDVCSSDLGRGTQVKRAVTAGQARVEARKHLETCGGAPPPETATGQADGDHRQFGGIRNRTGGRSRGVGRSEESRVGKECVRPGRARWARYT